MNNIIAPTSTDPKQIQKDFVVSIRCTGSENRLYKFADAATGRTFDIRRVGDVRGSYQYLLEEFIPNGRLVACNDKGHVIDAWDEPIISALEASVGPNALLSKCSAAGIDLNAIVKCGAGYSINNRYHKTLASCAKSISEALENNQRYSAYRELPEEEKAHHEHSARVSRSHYWHAEAAMVKSLGDNGAGILDRCYNSLGPIADDLKHRIQSYFNAPSQVSWNETRSICITGSGTLWQAWVQSDPAANTSGDVGFPSAEALRIAIVSATAARVKEIAEKQAQSGSAKLRMA